MTNCTAKKVEGHDKKFRHFEPDICPSPTFKVVPAPRYGARAKSRKTLAGCAYLAVGADLDADEVRSVERQAVVVLRRPASPNI